MNKARRKAIDELYNRLATLQTELENLSNADDMKDTAETIRDEEQEYFDNMPDSLQQGEKGQQASEAADNLTTAFDKLSEVADAITTLRDDVNEALEALDNAKAG